MPTPGLSAIPDEFEHVAGRPEDHAWAGVALLTLVRAGLAGPEVRRVLQEARRVVADSGESADDVFGEPAAWARERLAEASLDGATFTGDDSTAHDLAVVGLVCATFCAVAAGVVCLLEGQWVIEWNVAFVLAPLLTAAAGVVGPAVRERLVRGHTAAVATVAGFLVAFVLVGGAVLLLALHPVPLGRHSSLWWFAYAAALAAATWAVDRVVPDRPGAPVRVSSLDDERWLQEARARLRERGDLTETRIRRHLEEARDHAARAGTSLAEEFGNPVGYAAQLPVDRARRALRPALALTAGASMGAWFVTAGLPNPAWWLVLCDAVLVALAAWSWVSYLRVRSGSTSAGR